LGLPPIPLPEDNPPTPEKIALGRRLFFDRRLSVNNTMSCGLCHIPEQGFTNNELATPVGVEGRAVRRNAPTIVNAAFAPAVFQDGRGTSLETQVFDPLLARNEMANPSVNHLVDKIRRLEDYDGLFEAAFGGGPTGERIGMAIASWERTMVAGDSPFDRWKYGGNERALTAEQKRGFELFSGKAMCITCHPVGESAALFTDDRFHDTGIGYFSHEVGPIDEAPVPVEVAPGVVIPVDKGFMKTISEETELDFGRFEVTKDPSDKWRFRTPSLRNVALTAPYMHDGSLRTLEDVVRFYVRGGIRHDGLDPLIRPLDLTDDEVSALVEFLQGLTSADVDVLVEDARSVPIGN
jgi:cytochrome c peroxidase